MQAGPITYTTILVMFVACCFPTLADSIYSAERASVKLRDKTVTTISVRFDIATADMRLISFEDVKAQLEDGDQREGLTVDEYRENANLKLAISLIYLQKYSPPTLYGLVRAKGKTVNRQVQRTWAMSALLCFKPGKIVLGKFENIKPQIGDYPNCIQTGPLIIADRKSDVAELRDQSGDPKKAFFDQSKKRQFVCLAGSDIIFGATSEITAEELAESLQSPSGVARRACDSAISVPAAKNAGLAFADGADGNAIVLPYVVGVK